MSLLSGVKSPRYMRHICSGLEQRVMFAKVGVVGTGVIGASWTTLFLSKGLRVLATDPAPGAKERLLAHVRGSFGILGVSESHGEVLLRENLQFEDKLDPAGLAELDFVQESGPEKQEYKISVFHFLDRHTRPDIILASSSSGLPASQFIGECRVNPNRVLIGHPFNPPHLIPLVEVVPHPGVKSATVAKAVSFYESLDKKPVVIAAETPGFVANRLQAALVHEAYSLVSRGIVSAKDVDDVVTNSIALRWAIQGPFLTKVLGGGGGGIDGFRHHLSHVGKAAGEWIEDMRRNAFESTPESNEKLVESVQKELKTIENVDLKSTRDQFLIQVLQSKARLA
ncbi:hypothetical protein OIO90_003781 [Microbotryomycetes sp. JL221]|nr:hypothetical protein OIO90_003781 [Microbotryomycetes sp. JL221]